MNATSKTLASSNVTPTSIRVDGARLWQSLMDLAQIGATPKGGVRRLALTDLDRAGRDLVVGWCRDAGLELTETRGMVYNPITQVYSLSDDTDVNYLMAFRKSA